jgi:hypothetical protein
MKKFLKIFFIFLISFHSLSTYAKKELGNYDDYRNFQLDLQSCKSDAKNTTQTLSTQTDSNSGGSIGAQILSSAIFGLLSGISSGMEIGQKTKDCMNNLGWIDVDEDEKNLKKINVDNYLSFLKDSSSVMKNICQGDEYRLLFKKSSCEISKIDQTQLNDKSFITDPEKVDLNQLTDLTKSFSSKRIEFLKAIRFKSTDDEADVWSEYYLAGDENKKLLLEKRQTWGIYNKSRVENFSRLRQKLDNINEQRKRAKSS